LRETQFFPISFSSIFKYLWLGFDLMDMILH